MSSIIEKARAEGDAAEAETPDEEPTEPTEPDEDEEAEDEKPEPEPEPESTGRKQKTPQEKFQAAFAAFVKKAAECFELLPSDVVIAPYPGVVGIMLPGVTEPRSHENYMKCETCNGLGTVLTGAMTGDPSKDFHTCPDPRCKGRGYWEKHAAQPAAPATGPLAVQQPPPADGEWGEAPAWMGDPSITPGV